MCALTSNISALMHAVWRRRSRISFHQIRIRAHLGFDMLGGWRGDKGNEKWRRRSSRLYWLLERRVIGRAGRGVNGGIFRVFMIVKVVIEMRMEEYFVCL